MSLISRLRHHLPDGFCRNPILSPTNLSRKFTQLSMKEREMEIINQRSLPSDYDPATFDHTQHRSPPTDRVWKIVDEISDLTLVETAELSSILMKKMGVNKPPIVGIMKPGFDGMAMKAPTPAKEEKRPEKTVFESKLESYDAASKVKIIKEAKDLVEKIPGVIKKGVAMEEGEQMIEKMKGVGAKVVME